MFLIKTLLLAALNISAWQNLSYDELSNTISTPLYPQTYIKPIDSHTIDFISYAAYNDPGDKYYYVTHDTESIPTWLFVMNYKGKDQDELWHHDYHNGIICNKLQNNNMLLHMKTIGPFKLNLLFKVYYNIENTKYGTISTIELDKTYSSSGIEELNFVMWAFPHPRIKNLVIVAIRGHIKTEYPIRFFINSIRWHIDTALQNFGKRLISII